MIAVKKIVLSLYLSQSFGSITDKENNIEYPEFYLQEIWSFTEEFKPQGAESLPDAVNSSTEWNGKLEDAYSELAWVFAGCILRATDEGTKVPS